MSQAEREAGGICFGNMRLIRNAERPKSQQLAYDQFVQDDEQTGNDGKLVYTFRFAETTHATSTPLASNHTGRVSMRLSTSDAQMATGDWVEVC